MEQVVSNPQSADYEEVSYFLNSIYQDETGFCYIALKTPQAEHHAFSQFFFDWPTEKSQAIDFILNQRQDHEVYYAPSLFSERSGKKEHVKGARVFWIELDGVIPESIEGIPDPSVKIRSSSENHEHWYWQTDSLVQVSDLERVNRALTHLFGADATGFDANQILRPPSTFNHKRKRPVELVLPPTGKRVSLTDFASIPEPPPTVNIPVPKSIPDVDEVVSKYPIPSLVWSLFKNGKPDGKDTGNGRASGLMALGYYLAEMQMKNDEIFAMILNADMRWGKFKGRQDQYIRLAEIVTIARTKYPLKTDVKEQGGAGTLLQGLGFLSFLKAEYHFEWVWEGWVQSGGYVLLTGPSGVGKTQFSLDAARSFALGQEFLDRPVIPEGLKAGMLSLEMGGPDLQQFISKQASPCSQEELELLEENLLIEAIGEPIYMDTPSGRELVTQWIGDHQLQGVFIDSLGSSVAGELSQEGPAKALMDWNAHIRAKFGCFIWWVHHHRKASGENKKPNKLSDVYGSHYLTSQATTVSCLWDEGIPGQLKVIPLKTRLTADKSPFIIHRSSDLHFYKNLPEGVEGTGSEEFWTDEGETVNAGPETMGI